MKKESLISSLFSSPKAPAVPDPTVTAQAQSAANAETARTQAQLNRVNQYTPYGNSIFNNNGNDNWTQTITLPQDAQNALDAQNKATSLASQLAVDQFGNIRNAVSSPLDFQAQFGAAPTANDATRQSAFDAIFNQGMSRLQPQFDQDQRRLDQKLADQGIGLGTEAYKNAQDQLGRGRTDAQSTLFNSAQQGSVNQEAQQLGLENAQRQQGINESLTQRNQPINELAALLGTGGVQSPNFSGASPVNVGQTDVLGAYNLSQNAAQSAYNQQVGQQNALLGTLGGLAGSALGGPLGGMLGKSLFGGV